MSDLESMACESDGPVDAEVSQRLNHTSGGDHVSDEDTLPFVVKYYTSEETKCTFQLSNEDDDEIYSLFLDVVSEIVDALTERDTKKFSKFLNPLPDMKKDLQDLNKRRRGWLFKTDDDALLQKVLDKINSSAKELICPYQAHGKITCLDVTVQDDFDPTGELQKVIETNAAEVSDTESEAGEDTSIGEEKDDCVVDENPRNEGKETDDATRSNPENPCYFSTQIEMAAILKQRIEAIMDYYHEIANLSDVFDDIDFTVYTARYRMLSDQTEQRLCHPDAGVLSKEEVMLHKEHKGKKRMFMYGHGEDADMHFEHLKKEVQEKPKTLFIIIADECHWGITKDKDQKPSAHNLFINNWCEKSPRNVVVVQISATPFNLLTQDSRLPEVRCLVLHDKVTTTRKTYEAGDLLVEETEPELEERVKETAKKVELHVVDWSEVEVKNFERGMRMKLKSTLSEKGVRSLCGRQVSPDAKLDESPEEGDYLSAFLQVLPDGKLHITPGDEADATVFEVQGSHGIVTIKAVVSEEQVLTLTKDESGSLKAFDNPSMPTQFRVKLEYGVGVVAFVCSDGLDLYLTVNELGQVQLQPAKVESKGGVVITKPINDLVEVSFEFYMVQCGPKEVDMVGWQYVSLNYYLSTMNSKDQKIRQDEYFQKIVKNAKKQELSKIDFTVDAMLCAEYSYYVLHMSRYDSDDKVRQALTADMDKSPSAQFCETLKSFVRILTKKTSCIHHEVFEWVQIKLCEKVKDDLKTDCEALQKFKSLNDDGPESKKCKEELVDSFVACLMHLSPQELGELREKYADVKLIEEELKENNCEKLVKIWNTIVQESETNCLVQSLIQSGEQGSGKMKIVRAKSRRTADQFFCTLFQARRLASKEECFEIIRDYGKFNLKRLMTSSNTFFQKLQPRKCQFQCHCNDLKLHPGRPKCGNCQHVHKPITQYEDLQNLACVLILVDKGRMGDTFPESFDCLDLRLSYDEGSPIVLSTVIQELGRMCRYAKLSTDGSFVQNVPYALVGAQLFKRLKMSLDLSPAVRAISCTTVDRYMKNSKSKRKHSTSLRWSKFQADKESYDYQNNDREKIKHCNRILLQAEPQIGKTGTYLCLIQQLRKDILFKENDEGNFYLAKESSASEGHHVMNGNNEAEDWNFPYWKTIQESPSLLQKSVGPGKYSIGGRFYTHDTTNFPFILTKSEGLSQLTKTVYHRQVDNIRTGAVRAWHWYHFLNCAECGRFLEGKEPELQSIKVNIDGKPVTVKCSVPASRRPYKCLLEKLLNSTSQGEVWTEDSLASAIRSVRSSLFWIFHPSHRDDPCKCLLNYHHALQNENKEITFFQVAVVRSEKFQDYVKTWGKMLVIFQLPDQLPMEGEDEDVGPSEGGIGYARRFIQEMAFALKLEYVFVIDDNVAVMSEALVSPGEPATCNDTVIRNDDGVIRMEPCSFWRPLNYLQKIVRGKDKPPDLRKPYEAHPLTEEFDRQNLPLYRYTGPAKLFGDKPHESYGVLGFLRSVPNTVRPFAKTQVYAAILLNVKSTVEKRVWYRPWPCWEDLRFNDDCDKEGLWVVKCNRFHFHKVQYNDWINSLVLPAIFQWTEDTKVEKRLPESMLPIELEEGIILEHLLGLVNGEGHEKCFDGEIGYSDTQDNDSRSDISPMQLLEKLRINKHVSSALAKPVPILILAYSVLEPEIEDLLKLKELYCLAEEKIVFIVSAQEAEDELKNNLTLDCIDRGILKTNLRKKRKAKFDIFSAADPSRHLLRWIVIEASFKGEDISISHAADTPQDIIDAGVHELASSDQIESSVCEKSVSKRSVEEIVDGAKETSPQTRPSGKEDREKMVVDPNTFDNQLEPEQHTVVSFLPSLPGSGKRVTDSTTPETGKKKKIEDGTCNSTSANTVSRKMKETTVTSSLGNSVETGEKETPPAVQLGESPTREVTRGIVPSERQEEVVSDTPTLSQFAKKKAPKRARQQDVENGVPSASKRTKKTSSQITGLTPEDPAYIRGTSEITRSIVELWREKMGQKGNEDIKLEMVKAKLKNFETEDLERLDHEGFSALTKACSLPSMSPRIVSYLLNKKMVDVNSQLPDWFRTGDRQAAKLIPLMSALSMALLRGNVKCVSTFMQRKGVIKFESKDQKGNTALHYCVSTRDSFEKLWPNYEKMKWRDMRNVEGKNACDDAKEKYEKSSPTIETKTKKVTKNKNREALEFAISKMDPQWLKNKQTAVKDLDGEPFRPEPVEAATSSTA